MRRYVGRIITKDSVAPTTNAATAAKGVWTLDEAAQYKQQNKWPEQIIQVDQTYTSPGTYTFVVPSGINSISVVAIGNSGRGGCSSAYFVQETYYCCYFQECVYVEGRVQQSGGGGGGGGLSYRNNYSVTPGQSLTVQVGFANSGASTTGISGIATAFGGANGGVISAGGGGYGSQGCSNLYGGSGGGGNYGFDYGYTSVYWPGGGGGGGAGGYASTGGNGGTSGSNSSGSYSGGAGGGGGVAGSYTNARGGAGGGGSGLYGGLNYVSGQSPNSGGGSGNTGGGVGGSSNSTPGALGGLFGGGGGGGTYYAGSNGGYGGAVRIIGPGNTRNFPYNAAAT